MKLPVATLGTGSLAIHNAIEAFASLGPEDADQTQQVRDKRHRVEHSELSPLQDADRLGKLGILAGIQLVHNDPQILSPTGWAMLGVESTLGQAKHSSGYLLFIKAGASIVGRSWNGCAFSQSLGYAQRTQRGSSYAVLSTGRKKTVITPKYALPLATTLSSAMHIAAFPVQREVV